MKGVKRIRVDMPDHSARVAGFERPGEGMGPAVPALWGLFILSFALLALRQELWVDPWPAWSPGQPAVKIGTQGELHAMLTVALAVLQLLHVGGIVYLAAIVVDVRYRRTAAQVIEQGSAQVLVQGLVLGLLWSQLWGEWKREDYFHEHAPWDRGHCCDYEAYGLKKRPAWLMGPDVWVERHATEEGETIRQAPGPVNASDPSGRLAGPGATGPRAVPGASIGPPRRLAPIEGLGVLDEPGRVRPRPPPPAEDRPFVPLGGQTVTASWGEEPPAPLGEGTVPPPLVGAGPGAPPALPDGETAGTPAPGARPAGDPAFPALDGHTAVSEW